MPDFFGVYDNLTVMEYLEFYSAAYGIDEKEGRLRASEVLERVQLFHIEDRMVDELSRGMQQRLCLARAMIHRPQLLVMDEPASALDPISTAEVEELIHELKKQYTIVIVTHNMQQAARVSDNTAFFYMGQMVEFGDTRKIFTNPDKVETQNYITGRFG